jgi:hypothetical protein
MASRLSTLDKISTTDPQTNNMPRTTRRRHIIYLGCLLFFAADAFFVPKTGNIKLAPSRESRTDDSLSSTGTNPEEKHRVVIIGAGVGGLATAARIASETRKWGNDVEIVVVEKNSRGMIGKPNSTTALFTTNYINTALGTRLKYVCSFR